MAGSKSKIVFKPLPSDNPRQRQPFIELAKDKLNWEPQVQLEEGLKKTITYFDNLIRRTKTS
jgi:UDP-glucuronate decarboxylase